MPACPINWTPVCFTAKTAEESASSVGRHPSSAVGSSPSAAPYKRPFAIPSKIRQTAVQNAKMVQRFFFQRWTNPGLSFIYFRLFLLVQYNYTENFSSERESNSDRRSRNLDHRPLDHHGLTVQKFRLLFDGLVEKAQIESVLMAMSVRNKSSRQLIIVT